MTTASRASNGRMSTSSMLASWVGLLLSLIGLSWGSPVASAEVRFPCEAMASTYEAAATSNGAHERPSSAHAPFGHTAPVRDDLGATSAAASVAIEVCAVAAKPAIGFAEGLGHTALTPGRLQHGTKNLTKAGVLPAWSGKSSPAIIERSFTPILEHPTATSNHTLGGTRVRGFLGDINGQQVAAFVYKEGPYQGQLAS